MQLFSGAGLLDSDKREVRCSKFVLWSVAILFFLVLPVFGAQKGSEELVPELFIFRNAYPEAEFIPQYDLTADDWKITVISNGRKSDLYRAGGRYLSPEQLSESHLYKLLLYRFSSEVMDPADFDENYINRIKEYGSTENRSNGPVTSPAFFNAIFDITDRKDMIRHVKPIGFLGWRINVHEKIIPGLKRIESSLIKNAESDSETADFIQSLNQIGSYVWRTVRDTPGRSFHSMGLALDFLPQSRNGKKIYWNWEKNSGNELWMLVPLSERWYPPDSVVEIFEQEGFIWGGKWGLWDNMHFEYRPELIGWRNVYDAYVRSYPARNPLEAELSEEGIDVMFLSN